MKYIAWYVYDKGLICCISVIITVIGEEVHYLPRATITDYQEINNLKQQ